MAPKLFSLLFQDEGSFHATRWNLSQGGVLFCGDPNLYKGQLSSDGAKRGPSSEVWAEAKLYGTVRVVTDLD